MHEPIEPSSEQFDLVLEAIRSHGATVEQAAHYGGLRPVVLLELLQGNAELQVEVALARHTYAETNRVA